MCFFALLYKTIPHYPLVAGANRDEYRDRAGTGPHWLEGEIFLAGRDPRGGGTWLGLNRGGLLAAVTNLHTGRAADPSARSRGLLCLDVLREGAVEALDARLSREARLCNPFNLIVADRRAARMACWDGERLVRRILSPGLHVLGNRHIDDPLDAKVARGRELIGRPTDLTAALQALERTCRDTGVREDGTDAICVHLPDRGTLSSALLAVHEEDPRKTRFLAATASPREVDYVEYSQAFIG
jgi:uncharacterized protein with NRDE domain